jgi:hypothetical protein
MIAPGYGATALVLASFQLTKVGANTISLVNTTISKTGTLALTDVQLNGGKISASTAASVTASAIGMTLANTAGVILELLRSMSLGAINVAGTNASVTVASSYVLTVGNSSSISSTLRQVSGSGGLAFTGSANIKLHANSYTGPTTMGSTGFVRFGATDSPFGTSSSVTVSGACTLATDTDSATSRTISRPFALNANLSVDGGYYAVTLSGVISGTFELLQASAGTVTLSNTANTCTGRLSGSSTAGALLVVHSWADGIRIRQGSITIADNVTCGDFTSTSSTGVLTINSTKTFSPAKSTVSTVANVIAGAGGFTLRGTSILTLSGASTCTGIFTLGATGASCLFSTAAAYGAWASYAFTACGSLAFADAVGALTLARTIALANVGTASGTTASNSQIISLPTSASPHTISGAISGGGAAAVVVLRCATGADATTVCNITTSKNYTALETTIYSGSWVIAAGVTTPFGSTTTIRMYANSSANGDLRFSESRTFSTAFKVDFSGTSIHNGGFSITLSGQITGATDLILMGGGSFTLSYVGSTHTGAIVLTSACVLNITGTTTSDVVVDATETLSGGTTTTGSCGAVYFLDLTSVYRVNAITASSTSKLTCTGLTADVGFTIDMLGALNTGTYDILVSSSGTPTPTLGTNTTGGAVSFAWSGNTLQASVVGANALTQGGTPLTQSSNTLTQG